MYSRFLFNVHDIIQNHICIIQYIYIYIYIYQYYGKIPGLSRCIIWVFMSGRRYYGSSGMGVIGPNQWDRVLEVLFTHSAWHTGVNLVGDGISAVTSLSNPLAETIFCTLAFKKWEEILKTNIMYIIAKPGVRNICNNKCLCLIGNNKSSEQCLSKSVLLYKTIRVYVESKSTNIRYLPWNISSSICV